MYIGHETCIILRAHYTIGTGGVGETGGRETGGHEESYHRTRETASVA